MVASAAPDERTLVMVRTFEATPERLFAAWTDPAQFMEWFGPHGMKNTHCRFELEVGGTWELTAEGLGTTRAISGKYLAIDPPRLLSFTWAWHETGSLDTPREHETTVTLQFRPVGKRTELMLTQARFRDGGGTTRHNWGWGQSFEKLDAFLCLRRFTMTDPRIVSHEEWLKAQQAHLAREKQLTRLRDEIARERRALPWERVEKAYSFEGPEGRLVLADLFGGLDQLVVYHFMLGPDWKEGCPSCSFWADNYNGVDTHLAHRDTALVAVSRAPLASIEAYRKRMGWTFRWVASLGSDFNFDYAVSFDPAKRVGGQPNYNFGTSAFGGEEAPGISVFRRGADGAVYHTFSTYGRGLELVNGTYHMLDLTSKGRDEDGLPWPMAWVRRHDQY